MQKHQRPQTRTEGNVIYIIRELRKHGAENTPAPTPSASKAANQNAALDTASFKVEEREFAAEARLADKEGNDKLKERVCGLCCFCISSQIDYLIIRICL